jgi:hypothetical protein
MMTNQEKPKKIIPWINPEERITVNFLDAQDLNAEVMGCSDQSVDLSIETRVTHMKQRIAVPLSRVIVSEDPSHYKRDPERPLKQRRLMLVIDSTRPPIIYKYVNTSRDVPDDLFAPGEEPVGGDSHMYHLIPKWRIIRLAR